MDTKEIVELYVANGFSIIPLAPHDKRPVVRWQEFQDRRPTEQELLSWFGDGQQHNLGVVCGPISGGLCVLDCDDPLLLRDPMVADLANRTVTVKTSRGMHIYLRSATPGRLAHRPYHLDLIGAGAYVVAPPSIHPSGHKYEFGSNIRTILEVPDINLIVNKLDRVFGYDAEEKPVRKAVDRIEKGERNTRIFQSATVDRQQGVPVEAALMRAQTLNQQACAPPLSAEEVNVTVHSAYKKPYHERAAEKLINGDVKPEKLTTQSLKKDVFTPTPESQDYGSDEELFTEVVTFLRTYVDLPSPEYYSICALFALATWRVQQATVAPYLFLLAPQGSGKSTLQSCMKWLTYKSVHSAGATRGAIVRVVDGTSATLLLDETDSWLQTKDFDNPIMAILNAGYQRGMVALMCEAHGKTFVAVAKDPFGFKILSGRNPLSGPLESRCIPIRIRKSSRQFPKLNPEAAYLLRSRLARYSETHTTPLLDTEYVTQLTEPRLREIMEPLFACAPTSQVKAELLAFAKEEEQRRQDTEDASIEAEVAQVVVELITPVTTLDGSHDPVPKTLAVKVVTNELNVERSEKEEIKSAYVGVVLRRLGFYPRHTMKGNVVLIKPDLIEYLKQRYCKSNEGNEGNEG